jgi:hypothetical protein
VSVNLSIEPAEGADISLVVSRSEEVTVICEINNPGVPCCGFYIKEPLDAEADEEQPTEEAPGEEEDGAIDGADDVNEDEVELPPQEFECTPEIQRLAKLTNAVLLACI